MKHIERNMKRILAFSLVLLPVLTGCRKDLCYTHDEHSISVKTDVVATWECEWERNHGTDWSENWPHCTCGYDDLRPEPADGIRAIVYDEGGAYTQNNLSAEGGRLPMTEGKHSLLFYNNDTEYIVFEDLPSYATASATTRTRSRGSFEELHAGERTVSEPDMLFGSYTKDYEARRALKPVELPVTMHPLTFTYVIRYEFSNGLQYVALARGALAGMAESVYLQDGHTDDRAATILYEEAAITDYGVEAHVKTFGVPNYPGDGYGSRADQPYSLNLEVRLRNGKYKTFEFDITDQVENQPRGGVITVSGLEISDEEGTEGSGGFDPDVDDWGDEIDIELPLD